MLLKLMLPVYRTNTLYHICFYENENYHLLGYSSVTSFCWFLAQLIFDPEDGGDTFL
jgi:hypothetical protein